MSLGNASVALTDEPAAVFFNPGALGFIDKKGFQASLCRLYDLDELSEGEFCVVFPFPRFTLGGALYVFGKENYYQENVVSLAFSYRLKERLCIGSNLKYMRVSFSPEYDPLSAFSIDLGSTYQVNDRFQVGLVGRNLNQPELVRNSDDIPTNFSIGLAVFPFKEVTLLLDLSYEKRYKEQLDLGQEIKLLKNLPLRFGIQTSPARYAFGAGFNFDKLWFDYAYFNHSVLGDTHKISFSYMWGNKKS